MCQLIELHDSIWGRNLDNGVFDLVECGGGLTLKLDKEGIEGENFHPFVAFGSRDDSPERRVVG